jgi:hypothetical protein
VLRRSADPRDDVRDRELLERAGRRLRGEAQPEEQAAGAHQHPPRDPTSDERIARLDRTRGDRPGGGHERHGADADPELLDDLEEDEGQHDSLGVVDRVGQRQQPQRPLRMDLVGGGATRVRAHPRRQARRRAGMRPRARGRTTPRG